MPESLSFEETRLIMATELYRPMTKQELDIALANLQPFDAPQIYANPLAQVAFEHYFKGPAHAGNP